MNNDEQQQTTTINISHWSRKPIDQNQDSTTTTLLRFPTCKRWVKQASMVDLKNMRLDGNGERRVCRNLITNHNTANNNADAEQRLEDGSGVGTAGAIGVGAVGGTIETTNTTTNIANDSIKQPTQDFNEDIDESEEELDREVRDSMEQEENDQLRKEHVIEIEAERRAMS